MAARTTNTHYPPHDPDCFTVQLQLCKHYMQTWSVYIINGFCLADVDVCTVYALWQRFSRGKAHLKLHCAFVTLQKASSALNTGLNQDQNHLVGAHPRSQG